MNTDPSGYLAAALDQYWNLDKSITNYDRFYGFSEGGGGGWGGNGGVLPGWAQNGFGFGGGGGGFNSWADVVGETDKLYNSNFGGSSSGPSSTYYFNSFEEGLIAGMIYNENHNSWGNTAAKSADNAMGRFNDIFSKQHQTASIESTPPAAPFVGINDSRFPGIKIYYVPGLPNGFCLPKTGIFAPTNYSEPFLSHEYGHYLQFLYFGEEIFNNVIAKMSLTNSSKAQLGIITWSQYNNTLTEKNANTFSYNYFMKLGGTNQICQNYNRKSFPTYTSTFEFQWSNIIIWHYNNGLTIFPKPKNQEYLPIGWKKL